MQTISKILHVGTEDHRWCDEYGANANPPRVIIGTKARLSIDLRGDIRPDDDQLPPYDYSQFAGAVSWYFALDTDYDQTTIPPFLKTTGISVSQDEKGRTILVAELPDTDCSAIRNALATAESLQFKGEISALDGDGAVIVCLQFPVRLVNRVFIEGTVPAEVENDPAYLTSAQVQALIEAAVAAATEGLHGEKGDPGEKGDTGPAPNIEVGTVTTLDPGEEATAELVQDEETGDYTLNISIPQGETGGVPAITVGTVSTGSAAASITAVEGGYRLDLTIPPGTGIVPCDGAWSALVTYAKGDAIRHNGAWWYSKGNGNLDHEPPASQESDTYWQLIVKDGKTPVALTLTYAQTASGTWHASPILATDLYYRISEDGGATWSRAIPLSQPAVQYVFQFNEDATSDWAPYTAGASSSPFSTATGRYMRIVSTLGVVSTVNDIGEDAVGKELRIRFTADGETFHATYGEGDLQMHVFTADSTVSKYYALSAPAGDTIAEIQFCPLQYPWHSDYAENDRFVRISKDNGTTWTVPIPLCGIEIAITKKTATLGNTYLPKISDGNYHYLTISANSSDYPGIQTPAISEFSRTLVVEIYDNRDEGDYGISVKGHNFVHIPGRNWLITFWNGGNGVCATVDQIYR